MKTLERKTVEQPQKQMGQFASVEELAAYKTAQANKMLSRVKNLGKV